MAGFNLKISLVWLCMVWFGSISVSLVCSYLGWDKHTHKKKKLTHRMVYRVAAQLKMFDLFKISLVRFAKF